MGGWYLSLLVLYISCCFLVYALGAPRATSLCLSHTDTACSVCVTACTDPGLICFLNRSWPLFTLRLLHNSQLRSDHQQVPIYPSLDCLQEVAILLGFHGGSLFRMIYDEFANITDEQKAIMTFNYTTLLFRPDRCLWIVSHWSFSEDN